MLKILEEKQNWNIFSFWYHFEDQNFAIFGGSVDNFGRIFEKKSADAFLICGGQSRTHFN